MGPCCKMKATAAAPNALLGAGAAQPTSKHTGKARAWLPKIPAPCAMGSEAKPTMHRHRAPSWNTEVAAAPDSPHYQISLTKKRAVVRPQELPHCSKAGQPLPAASREVGADFQPFLLHEQPTRATCFPNSMIQTG